MITEGAHERQTRALPLDFRHAVQYPGSQDTDHWHNRFANMNTAGQPTYIDLFAGCGGLSLGLEKAGFQLLVAVEKSPMAAETFYHNFIHRFPADNVTAAQEWAAYLDLDVASQVERGLVVNDVRSFIDSGRLKELARKDVDLVAGGPPCQGFSMAGRRNPEDARNQLPWQFLEVVEHVRPKAVVIENVAGIAQDFLKHGAEAPFAQLRLALEATEPGYVVQPMRVNAMHFGVPEHRPRMLLVGLRSDIAERHHLELGLPLWRSEDGALPPLLAPHRSHIGNERTVRDALWDLVDDETGRLGYKGPARSAEYYTPQGEFARLMRSESDWLPPTLTEVLPPQEPLNATPRKHAPEIILRFQLYQYLQSQGIASNIMNIPADACLAKAEQEAEVRHALAHATYPAVAPTGRVLANTEAELAHLVMHRGTRKHSQRPLVADRPSPTVMSLPDDFVHYRYPRTLAVREVARLQSFPDHFEFRSKETTGSHRRRFEVPQYTQVGNAVPPLMALAIGRRLGTILAQ